MMSENKNGTENLQLEDLLDQELQNAGKLSVEDVVKELEQTEKGQTRQSIQNCVTVLQKDPVLAGSIRRNELTDKTEIVKDVGWKRRGEAITDTDVNQIRLYMENHYGLDGVERIRHLLPKYLGAEESDYVYEMTKLMMLGAISRAFRPGCKFEIMLCLVGGQGAGKSTLLRFLAIRDEWFTDDLRRLDDDNVYRKMQGHWFIEMAEMLATTSAKSIELIKSFLSRTKETYKIPYEVHPEDRPRQCVFLGTSNNVNFLPYDKTGNRRFAPVQIDASRAEHHPLENEQECRQYIIDCWAEAMTIYRSGDFKLTFPKEMEETVRAMQMEYMPDDSTFGVIQHFLDTFSGNEVCAIQIYEEAFGQTYDPRNRSVLQPISNTMNAGMPGWSTKTKSHRFVNYGTQRAWIRLTEEEGFMQVPDNADIPF